MHFPAQIIISSMFGLVTKYFIFLQSRCYVYFAIKSLIFRYFENYIYCKQVEKCFCNEKNMCIFFSLFFFAILSLTFYFSCHSRRNGLLLSIKNNKLENLYLSVPVLKSSSCCNCNLLSINQITVLLHFVYRNF